MALLTRKSAGILFIVELFILAIFVTFLYSRHRNTVSGVTNIFDAVKSVNQTFKAKTVLLYGATSFLGSKVAVALHQYGHHITLIEDMANIPLEPMAWYRWQKLQEFKLNPNYVEMNSTKHTFYNKKVDAVVFIPAPLFTGVSSPNKLFELKAVTKVLNNFVNLLEKAKKEECSVILLSLSRSSYSSIQKSWLRMFELSLSAYQILGVQTALITMDGVYGPWQGEGDDVYPTLATSCTYIGKIEKAVLDVLSAGKRRVVIDVTEQCSEQTETWSATKVWADEHTKFLKSRKDVVMSTYFTGVKNPSHPFQMRPRNGLFLKEWFTSAVRQGLNLVIFYDDYTDEFEDRIRNIHPNTEFVRVESMNGRSTNDYRFYLAYQYLLEHPEIRRAILTDMRDVKFVGDPFNQMEVIGDYLYIGVDFPFYMSGFDYEWVRNLMKKCHKADSKIDAVKLYPFLNAGVSGGTRHSLLAFLNLMTHYFDESPHHENCDMGILSIVCHKHFHDDMFNGYPYQRSFAMLLATPQGLSIKHKNAEKYYVYR